MIDLRRLLTFREVATRRSFSAAALELSYTQSSVSEAIATLERELGVTLLDRASRPIRLTPSGQIVLGHAERLLAQASAIETELAAITRGDAGRLRLTGFFTAWTTFLPPAVAGFADAHPRVELEFAQDDPPAAIQQLHAGQTDLAVIYRFAPGDPANDPDLRLTSTHLAHDPYLLAVPTTHRLAHQPCLTVADLATADWCSPPLDNPAAGILRQFCRDHGKFEPRLRYPLDDVALAQPLIAAGLAIAFLPALNLQRPHPGVTTRQLPATPAGREIWCLHPTHLQLPTTTAMISALTHAVAQMPND
jgi:DNA-binding transcriptional LysR family regulator